MAAQGVLIAGRYRLGERIGSGAMGVVWQATDERLQRTVALKHVYTSPGLSADDRETANARVLREGRIAARLHHHCAITVHDVVEHEGDPWLVQEYLPSRSLAQWLAESGPLDARDAATAGASVASALAVAHAAGVVHRDVKPANILLGDDGSVKITDFGISRASGDVTLTSTGLIAGTPAYLSPEMARGQTPAPPSDVFSLGSTLYAAVEGRAPFGSGGSENPIALLHTVAAAEFEPPRNAGLLTALIMRLMRADPAERPTMSQVVDALNEIRQGHTVSAEALEPPPLPAEPSTPPSGQPTQRIQPMPQRSAAPQPGVQQPGAQPPTTQQPSTPPRSVPQQNPVPQQSAVPQPTRQHLPAVATATARRPGSALDTRTVVLSVLAVLVAIAVGIGVSSLLMQLAG
ncbi:serine/threonine-protein kinase [Sciscionella sediminilitoris]|uniref:serine/threonine-protein kinase n=1 Tax=Sciscionella sediminilitoris TaxID=1445613 RepID=UPI000A63BFE1|nr:serine/threonine-protein kinase [Sciscionella sp. SE31]